jgi:hypothetical protein
LDRRSFDASNRKLPAILRPDGGHGYDTDEGSDVSDDGHSSWMAEELAAVNGKARAARRESEKRRRVLLMNLPQLVDESVLIEALCGLQSGGVSVERISSE